MSLSDTTENATLKMFLKGTDPSYRSGATQYLALFLDNAGTAADLEAGGTTYELSYTGGGNSYARVALTKASAWTDGGGSSFTNAGIIQFAKRTDAGATQSAKYFAVVDTASGAYNMGIWGQLSSALDISINIQPQFGIGDLTITAD
jgi:hypothetical protein